MRPRRRTARDLQVHGALPFEQVVLVNEPFLQRSDRVEIEAGVYAKFFQPARQATCVAIPFEEPAANDAGHFINAVAEKESALVDRELGLVPREELAVQVND